MGQFRHIIYLNKVESTEIEGFYALPNTSGQKIYRKGLNGAFFLNSRAGWKIFPKIYSLYLGGWKLANR